jgi:hypothetical protein
VRLPCLWALGFGACRDVQMEWVARYHSRRRPTCTALQYRASVGARVTASVWVFPSGAVPSGWSAVGKNRTTNGPVR